MHSGQKVECIKAVPDIYDCPVPVLGGIYHLRDFDGIDGWRLIEIVNSPMVCVCDSTFITVFCEPSFGQEHFRPITDISALQKLTKVRELEDA